MSLCLQCGIDRKDIDAMHAKCSQLRADVYDAVDTLEQLIEWEVYMGGFENPAWDRARGVVARINGQRFP